MAINPRLYGPVHSQTVTPVATADDTNKITADKAPGSHECAGLWVGDAGDVTVVYTATKEQDTLPNVAPGMWHAMQISHVLTAGTTATNIRAGFQ